MIGVAIEYQFSLFTSKKKMHLLQESLKNTLPMKLSMGNERKKATVLGRI